MKKFKQLWHSERVETVAKLIYIYIYILIVFLPSSTLGIYYGNKILKGGEGILFMSYTFIVLIVIISCIFKKYLTKCIVAFVPIFPAFLLLSIYLIRHAF